MNGLLVALGLVLSGPARTTLQYYTFSPVEVMGCLMGTIQGDSLNVQWVRPLPVEDFGKDRQAAATTKVVPTKECPADALGRVHSHPDAKYCWYVFPGTAVPSSDGVSFLRLSKYPIDAIVCGNKLVWVDRNLNQHEQTL